MLLLSAIPIVKNRIKNRTIQRWAKALNLTHHQAVFDTLFQDTNGFLLSRLARQVHDAFDYTYGEIEFLSFIALIALTKPTKETLFYDLGSGTGKATIACALVFELKEYYGIELFEPLHEAAISRKNLLEQIPAYQHRVTQIEFIQDDFLNVDLTKATLIFINSTAFVGDLWDTLSEKLAEVALAATIITISKKLKGSVFTVQHTTQVTMSWGIATAYIQAANY
jgi:precorrin-6B methylase 2